MYRCEHHHSVPYDGVAPWYGVGGLSTLGGGGGVDTALWLKPPQKKGLCGDK